MYDHLQALETAKFHAHLNKKNCYVWVNYNKMNAYGSPEFIVTLDNRPVLNCLLKGYVNQVGIWNEYEGNIKNLSVDFSY